MRRGRSWGIHLLSAEVSAEIVGEPFFQGRSRAERLEIATSGSYQGSLSFELLLYIPIYSESVNQYVHVLQRFSFCSYVLFHSMHYSQQMTDDADLLQSNSFMLPLQESGKNKKSNFSRKTHSPARKLMPYILHQNVLARVAKKACPCHLLSY